MAHDILIIDDEVKLRELLSRIIALEGFEVTQVSDIRSAEKKIKCKHFEMIFCDVKLPDGNGVEFVKKIKELDLDTEVILLTAYGNIPDGVQAIKNGAFDYITKGDDNSKIIPLMYRALEKIELAGKVKLLEKQLNQKYSFERIIGNSKSILKALELAKKVAKTDTTVLLTGETGTGKEVFAQAIHYESLRKLNNFIAINCSAISKELLESEMFGHVAGAFTGANKDKTGLFLEADKGTIFLDEIGEMAIDLQAKLLRVLETGEFYRVGDNKPTRVNVRIIAATNRNLINEIESGHFREDLYYRISVFQLNLPALRDRLSDIELLCRHFIDLYSTKMGKKIESIEPAYMDALRMHSWPGNIRELKNIVERSVILADNKLEVIHLPMELQQNKNSRNSGNTLSAFDLASAEKLHIRKVLNYTNGNKTKAAELLNIALTTLYRKISEYKLE